MLVNVWEATECWSMNGWLLDVGKCLGDKWKAVNVLVVPGCWSMFGW